MLSQRWQIINKSLRISANNYKLFQITVQCPIWAEGGVLYMPLAVQENCELSDLQNFILSQMCQHTLCIYDTVYLFNLLVLW